MATPQTKRKVICDICKEHEDKGDGAKIWWIKCSTRACGKEFHFSCIGLTADNIPGCNKHWYCPPCAKTKEMRWLVRRQKEKTRYQARVRSLSLSRIEQFELSTVASEGCSPQKEDKAPERESEEIVCLPPERDSQEIVRLPPERDSQEIVRLPPERDSQEIVRLPPIPSDKRDLRNVITFIALVISSLVISYLCLSYEF